MKRGETRNVIISLAILGVANAHLDVANGKEFLVTPATDTVSVAKAVVAGDAIILADGVWRDVELKFERLPGRPEAPIRIRPQNVGQVIFTGATKFRFSGRHVHVSGFVFRDTDNVSDVVQLRTHSERLAHDCRFTECVFEQTATAPAGTESRWLSIYGTNNRIDHCYFAGKRSIGPSVVIWLGDRPGKHTIDHNFFGPRPKLSRNGGETIRIGTSQTSESVCQTIVERNYFFMCNGEAETISNKSCENVYRHNVFDQCAGTLTLRHGHRCQVDANLFLGRKQQGTGGVRIIGSGHTVTNNYFEGLRGDAERAALCMMNGIPNGDLNSYAPVRKAIVEHNTFIDCKVPMELGVGAGKKQSAAPTECRFANNIFAAKKWTLLRIHAAPVDSVWQGNKREGLPAIDGYPTEAVQLQFERAKDGLLRPSSTGPLETNVPSTVLTDIDGHPRVGSPIVGCDQPNTPRYVWPTRDDTGPSWFKVNSD